MSTSNNIYVKKTHIADISVSELDIELNEAFGFDYDIHEDFVELQDKQGSADGHPIKIDQMIDILRGLKGNGATHVDLSYHCDHIGYDISGYKIELADQAAIDEFEEAKNRKLEKNKKADELRQQLRDLENEDNSRYY